MKLNISILEDQKVQEQLLLRTIECAAKEIDVLVSLLAVSSGLDIIEETVMQTDLFFLDVETPHRTGIDTAKFIRSVSKDVPIVFTTNFKDYAVKGYEVHAFQFLLKPVKIADCIACLKSAMTYARLHEQESLKIMQSKECRILLYRDILYVEASNHVCNIFYDNGVISYRKNISVLRDELPSKQFIQCHRSFLINLDRVRVLKSKMLILDNGKIIPVSDTYYSTLEQLFAQKLLEDGGRWL